jgi:hypothetical protein
MVCSTPITLTELSHLHIGDDHVSADRSPCVKETHTDAEKHMKPYSQQADPLSTFVVYFMKV